MWAAARAAIAESVAAAAAFQSRCAPAAADADAAAPGGTLCFELIGVDMLAGADGRVWMLEVQRTPSLASTSPLDRRVKSSLAAAVRALLAASQLAEVELAGALPSGWTRCESAPISAAEARAAASLAPPAADLANWRARASHMQASAAYETYLDSLSA